MTEHATNTDTEAPRCGHTAKPCTDSRTWCPDCATPPCSHHVTTCRRATFDDRLAPTDTILARNLRVLVHEAETPARGHDSDGACCFRAAFPGHEEETKRRGCRHDPSVHHCPTCSTEGAK